MGLAFIPIFRVGKRRGGGGGRGRFWFVGVATWCFGVEDLNRLSDYPELLAVLASWGLDICSEEPLMSRGLGPRVFGHPDVHIVPKAGMQQMQSDKSTT